MDNAQSAFILLSDYLELFQIHHCLNPLVNDIQKPANNLFAE
jgi:hypothetical protein